MLKAMLLLPLLIFPPAMADPIEEASDLMERGRFEEARKVLEQAVSEPSMEAEGLVLLTRACNAMEDFQNGIEYGSRAVELLPESSEAHFQYAVALRTKMSKVNKMRAMFMIDDYKKELKTALDIEPDHVDALEEEIGYLLNAPGIAGGDKDEAKKKLEALKSVDRRRALIFESDILRDEGRREEGMAVLESLLEEDPEDDQARQVLAFWYQTEEHYPEAIAQFEALAESEDSGYSMGARYQLARSRILAGFEPEKEAGILEVYIKDYDQLDPDTRRGLPSAANAFWRMGMAYEQLEEIGRARDAFSRALELDPDNKEAKKALKNLPR
jgi:tetratricopeptide (TPR) repeat protein